MSSPLIPLKTLILSRQHAATAAPEASGKSCSVESSLDDAVIIITFYHRDRFFGAGGTHGTLSRDRAGRPRTELMRRRVRRWPTTILISSPPLMTERCLAPDPTVGTAVGCPSPPTVHPSIPHCGPRQYAGSTTYDRVL